MEVKSSNYNIRVLDWRQAQKLTQKINPTLSKLIDKISPSSKYKLIQASYRFGDLITKHGEICIPRYDTTSTPISQVDELSEPIVRMLKYTSIPAFILLNKSAEIFLQHNKRIIPLNLAQKGEILGLFEVMNYLLGRKSNPKWSISAGSRSIFLLPKINEEMSYKRLRDEFNLNSNQPTKELNEQWELFAKIASHHAFPTPWSCDILFFSKEWLSTKNSGEAWEDFRHFLFKKSWLQGGAAIDRIYITLEWQSLIEAAMARRLKATAYVLDQSRHLLALLNGQYPGFRPIVESESSAPLTGLTTVFKNIYRCKYHPTFMHIAPLNTIQEKLPIYYSISLSTIAESSPKKNRQSTIMTDLCDIKNVLDTLIDYGGVSKSILNTNAIQYFHVNENSSYNINASSTIPELDAQLAKFYSNKEIFCSSSKYWKGCFRLEYF